MPRFECTKCHRRCTISCFGAAAQSACGCGADEGAWIMLEAEDETSKYVKKISEQLATADNIGLMKELVEILQHRINELEA